MAIQFTRSDVARVPAHRVYLRRRWNDPWEENPYLHAAHVEWKSSPEVGTATLLWRYGQGMRQREKVFAEIARLAKARWYVKIEIDKTPNTAGAASRTWHGSLEISGDYLGVIRIGGNPIPSGQQQIVGYSLENLLDYVLLDHAYWLKPGGNWPIEMDWMPRFNAGGIGNRSAGVSNRGAFCFGSETGQAAWSTRTIVQYLLAHHLIQDAVHNKNIPVSLDAASRVNLPDWDRPEFDGYSLSLRDLLNRLVSRQRLLGWRLEVVGDEVSMKVFTFTSDALPLGAGKFIPRNRNQDALDLNRSPAAAATLKSSSIDQFDCVKVRGARRRSVFTVDFPDGTLKTGWTGALQTAYEAAASAAADYPPPPKKEKRQRRNADARGAEKFATVFSRFTLPDPKTWNRKAQGAPVVPLDLAPLAAELLWPPGIVILPTLPLLEGFDYSGSAIAGGSVTEVAAGPHEELPPLVVCPLTEDGSRFQRLDRWGLNAELEQSEHANQNRSWSASVRAAGLDHSFSVSVDSMPQHVIAYGDFTKLPEDEEVKGVSYSSFRATVAILDHRWCEAQYPANPELAAAGDQRRTFLIDVGDGFRTDYCAPNTVVGVKADTGELQISTGGFIRDDREILRGVARLAHSWYSAERRVVTGECGFHDTRIAVGLMILSVSPGENVDVQVVDSVITDVSLDIPLVENGPAGNIRMSFQTAFGQLDPLQFRPRGVS